MLILLMTGLPLASAQDAKPDETPVTFGDFDADGHTDVAIGMVDGTCGYVDIWLSSADPSWTDPRRSTDLPSSTLSVRPSRCDLDYGGALGTATDERGNQSIYLGFPSHATLVLDLSVRRGVWSADASLAADTCQNCRFQPELDLTANSPGLPWECTGQGQDHAACIMACMIAQDWGGCSCGSIPDGCECDCG
ncbi:MAG: hypothetical protein AAGA48_23885 [Myxococcota bacterium]